MICGYPQFRNLHINSYNFSFTIAMGCHVYSTKGARVLIHSTSPMALEHTSQWVDDQRVHYPLYKYSCLDWGWSWYPWTRSSQMYQQLVWFSQKWGHLPILGGYTEESHDAATREPIPLVSSRGVFFLMITSRKNLHWVRDFTIKTWKTYGLDVSFAFPMDDTKMPSHFAKTGEAASRCGGFYLGILGVVNQMDY